MGLFAKISITPEVSGVGSLNTLPPVEFVRQPIYIREKVISKTELNYKLIRVKNVILWRIENIVWENISKVNRDLIVAFYDSHFGQDIPFLWTPPTESSALLFHFSSQMVDSKINPNVYSINVEIEQLTP
tara:strand:- start:105 stop:494 length:390 start_codon:yes stop_codon:yes gene_type:complete